MLIFQNGESFTTGEMEYEFKPVSPDDINNRIILSIKVEGIPAIAVIDTGAPYLIIAPSVANRLDFDNSNSLGNTKLTIRRDTYSGNLFRVGIILPAKEGDGLQFEATAFVPEQRFEETWGNLPTFLGIDSCLDRVRFAIDPCDMKFHFGSVP